MLVDKQTILRLRFTGQRKLGDFHFARTAVKVRLAESYCKSRHDFIYIFIITSTVHFARGPVSLGVTALFERILRGTR